MTKTKLKEGKSEISLEQTCAVIFIILFISILLISLFNVRLEKETNIEEEIIIINTESLYSRENVVHYDCIGEVHVWSLSENVIIFDAHYDGSSKIKGACTLYIETTKLKLKWL